MINEKYVSDNLEYDDVIWAAITRDGKLFKETNEDGTIKEFSEINDNIKNFKKFGFMGNTVFIDVDLDTKAFEINKNSIKIDLLRNGKSILKDNDDFKLIGFRKMGQHLPTDSDPNPKPFTLSYNFGYRVNNSKCNARIFLEFHKQEKNKLNIVITVPEAGYYTLKITNRGRKILDNSIKLDASIKNNITLNI